MSGLGERMRRADSRDRSAPPLRSSGPAVTPASTPETPLLRMQRLAGNAAVAQFLGVHQPRRPVQRDDEDEKKQATPPPDASTSTASPDAAPALADAATGTSGVAAAPAGAGTPASTPATGTAPATADASTPAAKIDPAASGPAAVDAAKQAAPAKPAPGPSFARDPGCDIEAPALPTQPTALPFAEDPKAKLPAKEAEPSLSAIPADKPWWNETAARDMGAKLAECYASRTAKAAKPIDKDAKLAELQSDFDDVIKGWLNGRTRYGRWAQLPATLAAMLQRRRGEILRELQAANAKLPKDQRSSKDDLDAALELRMQRERHDLVEDVRLQVAIGTWGWMAERREKLDFDTIAQKQTGPRAVLAELLTDDESRQVVRALLVAKGKAFTDAEKAKVVESAQKARDAAAKAAAAAAAKKAAGAKGAQPAPPEPAPVALTTDEQEDVIAKAERDRVSANKWGAELKKAMIEARTTKDAADLVLPTKGDVKGWDTSGTVRIHKDVVALLKVLETEFPKGFNAATYKISVEGDHASSGFEGRFRSLDMYPGGGPSRNQKPFGQIGFFDKQIAFDFARAIDRAVTGRGTFQILYNDFEVAREVNKVLKNGRMFNMDNVTADKGGASNLNWHGPLVTHFHVDFAI
jgi:hypothetical protein